MSSPRRSDLRLTRRGRLAADLALAAAFAVAFLVTGYVTAAPWGA